MSDNIHTIVHCPTCGEQLCAWCDMDWVWINCANCGNFGYIDDTTTTGATSS